MDLLEKARGIIAAIREGREALAEITDALRDGDAAISAGDQAELTKMLADEEQETTLALSSARDAIAQYRAES